MCEECRKMLKNVHPDVLAKLPEASAEFLTLMLEFNRRHRIVEIPERKDLEEDGAVLLAHHLAGFLSTNLQRSDRHAESLQMNCNAAGYSGRLTGNAVKCCKRSLN